MESLNCRNESILKAIEIHARLTGEKPAGWYTGRTSEHTRGLVAQYGNFEYGRRNYSDDLPFWSRIETRRPHLVVPYTSILTICVSRHHKDSTRCDSFIST